MLILLPPSAGQTAAVSGATVDLDALALPALTPARTEVLTALETLCRQPETGPACDALGLGPSQLGEVRLNAQLRSAPAGPAGQIYTGVLYDALNLAALGGTAHALANRSILIFSGLWGALRLTDRVPAYRCPIGARLPGPGALTGHWRAALAPVMPTLAEGRLLLDLRSAAYAAMWRPRAALAGRTVVFRVLHERVERGAARRSVVSHFNKATKGRLVHDLLAVGVAPETPAELVTALRDLKYTVEVGSPQAGGIRLDVVVTEL